MKTCIKCNNIKELTKFYFDKTHNCYQNACKSCKKDYELTKRTLKKQLRNIYTIYKVTNLINNKIYIGFTSKSLEERRQEHIYRSNHTGKFYFHNSLIKYGIDNFKWEEIYQSKDLNDCLDKEIYFIEFFKTKEKAFGYNLGPGGKAERLGVKVSNETKKKQSESAKARGANWGKKIIAMELTTEYKQEFNSIREAARALNLNPTSISLVINGHKNSVNNLTFKVV